MLKLNVTVAPGATSPGNATRFKPHVRLSAGLIALRKNAPPTGHVVTPKFFIVTLIVLVCPTSKNPGTACVTNTALSPSAVATAGGVRKNNGGESGEQPVGLHAEMTD